MVIIIEGNGFNLILGKIIVIIGGEICEIIMVLYGVIKCVILFYLLSDVVFIEVIVDFGEGLW